MSDTLPSVKKSKKSKNDKFEKLIGDTDPKLDAVARDRLIAARVGLLMKHSFFGNLATRLKLINADSWCSTAATDGRNFYYNSKFINMLKTKEVEFLFGHEVLHVVYDHMGRRNERDPRVWNIANDYCVNADLKRHRVGEFITTVPCLYESKYDGKASEEVYDDLMKNAEKIDLDDLIEKLIDDHMDDESDGEGDGGEGEDGNKKGRPRPLSPEEREQLRQEIKQNILAASRSSEPGSIPGNVQRLIKNITDPKMPWRELISVNLTSTIRTNYSFSHVSRRAWHMDAILPGMTPGEEIDIAVAIDMSGSISEKQASVFLGEIRGIMQSFDGFKIHVFCFDTEVYNPQDFTNDNLDTIEDYEPMGGGGTELSCVFNHLKERGTDVKRLIVFTDGYVYDWGDPNFADTTWIIHGNPGCEPPFGTHAHFDEK